MRRVGTELRSVLRSGAQALQVDPAIEAPGSGSAEPFLTPYAARYHDGR
jgi:hypothetical protein